MKVICAGMSKTGTKTMNAALRSLNYEVYDYFENLEFLYDQWMRVVRIGWNKRDIKLMFENVDATCDIPSYYFWEDMVEAFPDAKVILMIRDNEDEWIKSMEHQMSLYQGLSLFVLLFLSSTFRKLIIFSSTAGILPFGITSPFYVNKMVYKQNYRRHNAHVLHNCPKEKLLVYNCKEGWEPLCKFLDKPVPNKAFPHENVKGKLATDSWKMPIFRTIIKEAICTGVFAVSTAFCLYLEYATKI